MAVYKGGQKIEDLYCGSAKIGKIYKGSTLVYSSVKYYTFTINPTPSNATVKINNQTTKSVTVVEGTSISWSVSASGYTTQSGTLILTANTTKNVALAKAGPLYACYYGDAFGFGTFKQYFYAKYPLVVGSTCYMSSLKDSNSMLATQPAKSTSEITPKVDNGRTAIWKTITETTAVFEYNVTNSLSKTIARYTAGDLYK